MNAESERARAEADRLRQDRATDPESPPANGATVLVCQTYNSGGSYPASAKRFYWLKVCAVAGAEVEGGTGTITPGTRKLRALNLGTRVPPHSPATDLVVRWVRSRYVFRY